MPILGYNGAINFVKEKYLPGYHTIDLENWIP